MAEDDDLRRAFGDLAAHGGPEPSASPLTARLAWREGRSRRARRRRAVPGALAVAAAAAVAVALPTLAGVSRPPSGVGVAYAPSADRTGRPASPAGTPAPTVPPTAPATSVPPASPGVLPPHDRASAPGRAPTAGTTSTARPPVDPAARYVAAVLADSPLGYWSLDERSGTTAADRTGRHPGAYHGPALGVPGVLGPGHPAARFDGGSTAAGWDDVDVPDAPDLHTGERYTLELWVKRARTNPDGADQPLVSKGFGGFDLLFDHDRLTLAQAWIGTIVTARVPTRDTTRFHHCVAVRDGNTFRLYLDGVDVTGPVSPFRTADTGWSLTIATSYAPGRRAPGVIDEVAYYGHPLGAGRVRAHLRASPPAAR